ncbi:hypothetical protein REPUB_Repub01dG0107300 [Reevesia pubescens]
MGAWTHAYSLKKCDFDFSSDVLIDNSLVDMYCECVSLELAQQRMESVELSEELAREVVESGYIGSGVYMLFSRVYGSASRWDEVGLVRKLMTDKDETKELVA